MSSFGSTNQVQSSRGFLLLPGMHCASNLLVGRCDVIIQLLLKCEKKRTKYLLVSSLLCACHRGNDSLILAVGLVLVTCRFVVYADLKSDWGKGMGLSPQKFGENQHPTPLFLAEMGDGFRPIHGCPLFTQPFTRLTRTKGRGRRGAQGCDARSAK